MKDLNFNVFAMTQPSTHAEVLALLDEAVRVAHDLDDQIQAIEAALELKASAVVAA